MLDTLIKTGVKSIEATIRRRWILFAGFVARMEDTRLQVRDVRRGSGGRGLRGGPGKRVDGVFLGRHQSFRYRRRPVDTCSLGREETAQDGEIKDDTFHGKIDRCRERQGWTTACNSMPKRDGKGQGENSPKQACSCWFARHN